MAAPSTTRRSSGSGGATTDAVAIGAGVNGDTAAFLSMDGRACAGSDGSGKRRHTSAVAPSWHGDLLDAAGEAPRCIKVELSSETQRAGRAQPRKECREPGLITPGNG